MSLFLANSVPFGVCLTMAVNCVVEKEAAVAVLSYGQCCCQQAFYIDVCVYKYNAVTALCVNKPVINSGKQWLKIEVHFRLAVAFRILCALKLKWELSFQLFAQAQSLLVWLSRIHS